MSNNLTSLDDLFKEARKHQATAKAVAPAPVQHNAQYANPLNWKRVRGVALVRAECKTLLGNFSEYVYLHDAGIRKLVREDSPIEVSAVEEIDGSLIPQARTQGYVPLPKHPVSVELELEAPDATTGTTDLLITVQGQGILRADLVNSTTFTTTETGEFLIFPAGTNLLPQLTRRTKLAIRKALPI